MKLANKKGSFVPRLNQRHHSTHASPMNIQHSPSKKTVMNIHKEATHQEILNFFTYNNVKRPGAPIQVNDQGRHANSVLLMQDTTSLEKEKDIVKDKWIISPEDSKFTNYDRFMNKTSSKPKIFDNESHQMLTGDVHITSMKTLR